MDTDMILIFVGFFLAGMIAGIPIGQALEHRRCSSFREAISKPVVLSKEEIGGITLAELGEILEGKQR